MRSDTGRSKRLRRQSSRGALLGPDDSRRGGRIDAPRSAGAGIERALSAHRSRRRLELTRNDAPSSAAAAAAVLSSER